MTQTIEAQEKTYGPALQKMLNAFPHAREGRNGWWSHADNPRFDFIENENGSIGINAWTNHSVDDILAMGDLTRSDIHPSGYKTIHVRDSIDMVQLAIAKRIHHTFLYNLGLQDEYKYRGQGCIKIPYFNEDGSQHTKIKIRKAIEGKNKHGWDENTPGSLIPYGLNVLKEARKAGYLFLVEGESDCWTLWAHGLPALGIPGATNDQVLKVVNLNDIPELYIIQEPDQHQKMLDNGEGFYTRIHKRLTLEGYTGKAFCANFKKTTGYGDPSDLHIALFDK